MNKLSVVGALLVSLSLQGCATESHKVVAVDTPEVSVIRSVSNAQIKVVIGQFANSSSYQNEIFSDELDRLGTQAQTILITSLQQAGCYMVLDRNNMQATAREAGFAKSTQNIKGAKYIITGDVTEFGRKTVGDRQLFGILGHGKTQVAYAKVSLNVVDVETTAVVWSSQGAGEYALSNREVLGFGGTASYDSTLNGKVLSLAIREAVNNLTNAIDNGSFKVE